MVVICKIIFTPRLVFLIFIFFLVPFARAQTVEDLDSEETPQILEKNKCEAFGDQFKPAPAGFGCFDLSFFSEAALAANDPTDSIDDLPIYQFTTRGEIDLKWLKQSKFGTLSAFIRLQSQFDPGVSEDLILGRVARDFASGLDAFQLQLNNSYGEFKLGKIENAGSVFIADGFTRRGAESLDARSGLGVSYQTRIKGIDVIASISDPGATVSGSSPDRANVGLGLRKNDGALSWSLGLAAISVDGFQSAAPLSVAVRNGSQFLFAEEAEIGLGVAAQLAYVHPLFAGHVGATFTKDGSNDVVFAFSDGFDALTLFGGLTHRLRQNLRLNLDFSYITATEAGFRNQNGIDSAINVVWSPLPGLEFLTELGFDSVDAFGAGSGFFFESENPGEVGGYFAIRRRF